MKKNDGLYSRLPDDIPRGDAEQALELLAEFNQEKELAMAEITRKYDFYEKLFAAVFAERKAVADGFFRVIDQGIREKNNDLVLAGLSSLSGMVASSPLTNLGSLRH
jgi:hypothetical protein